MNICAGANLSTRQLAAMPFSYIHLQLVALATVALQVTPSTHS